MKTGLIIATLLLTGCANITHKREVTSVSKDGTRTNVVETESGRFFFSKESAQKMNIATRDANYSHSFSATGIQAQGDTDMIKAIDVLMKDAAAIGAKGAVAP